MVPHESVNKAPTEDKEMIDFFNRNFEKQREDFNPMGDDSD